MTATLCRHQSLTRNLGAFEHLIWLIDQCSPRHFLLAACIEGSAISEDRLRRAFHAVQRRHPALCTAIEAGPSGVPHFAPTDAPIQLRTVDRTDETQWQRVAEVELAVRFDTSKGPLLRATLVRGDAVSELILAVHHSIGDGISAMYLVRDLLEVLEGHQLGELPARASLEELAGITQISGAQLPAPAGSDRVGRPGVARIANAQIQPALLEALLDRCRKEGTTFEGALLAAILLDGPIDGCLAPVSARHLCPGISDDFGVYISSGTALRDPNSAQDFWTVARSARNRVARALKLEVLQARNAGMRNMVVANNDPQSASAALHRLVNYSAVLSNLGRFPILPKVKNFRVTAVYPVLNVELEPIVTVATVNGRMSITTTMDGVTGADWIHSILNRLQTQASA